MESISTRPQYLKAPTKPSIVSLSPFRLRSGQASALLRMNSAKGLVFPATMRFFAALLRNKISGSDRLGEKREAQSRRGPFEMTNSPLTEVLVIGLLTLRLIGSAMFEHMIEHPRQLMRRGRDRVRRAFARPQPAVITAQG